MITSSALMQLKWRFNGRLIEPHDAGYDAARLVTRRAWCGTA